MINSLASSTTYILHGGNTSIKSPTTTNFFAEFTSEVNKDVVNVLFCFWARERVVWNNLFQEYSQKININSQTKVRFGVTEDPDHFKKEINNFDIFYVVGGEAEYIESYYSQMSELSSLLKGKIYVGGSMGAFMVSQNYVLSFADHNSLKVHTGLGLLPINLLCHWNVEKNKQLKIDLLKQASANTPIVALNEGEYIKFII